MNEVTRMLKWRLTRPGTWAGGLDCANRTPLTKMAKETMVSFIGPLYLSYRLNA
jgi:hypothetical protein